MFKFEYEIKLTEDGRPYISPINGTENEMAFVEHKFMSLEMTRSILTSTIELHENNPEKRPLPAHELERLKSLEYEITRLSNIFARTIKDQFDLLGIADQLLNKEFDLTVLDENERDNLNYNGIIFGDKIFKRVEGLKVKLTKTGQVFELKGGIDNQHWTEIK